MINKYKLFVYIVLLGGVSPAISQSLQDLQNLRKEYEDMQKDKRIGNKSDNISSDIENPGIVKIAPYSLQDIDEDFVTLKHFGYDFFSLRDTVSFWENLPIPNGYLLGSGDELVVSIWGETQLRQTYIISKEGKIYDEKVGLLNLSGRTLKDARLYLAGQFGRVYSTLNGQNPRSFIDVSLGELRSINVNFVGQVKYPGVYPVHPFSNVILGLIKAGGVDTTGSLRKIQINRNNEIVTSVDLYQYFTNGDIPSNIQLRDQDIIFVPPRTSNVEIDSVVLNPGIFEAMPGESVYDLINYAGGLKQDASETIMLRIHKTRTKTKNGTKYKFRYVDYESTKSIEAKNVDKIHVRNSFFELNQVELIGQVKTPGYINIMMV